MKNNKIYRFLTSIRLAIALLIAIAILCILCTFIPQNQSETVYVQKYGEFMAAFIQRLGFDNILNSFWMYIVGMIFKSFALHMEAFPMGGCSFKDKVQN